MGQHNHNSRPRGGLKANRESRPSGSRHVFSMFRPVSDPSIADIYERALLLQDDNVIPSSLELFTRDLRAVIIPKTRSRDAYINGLAAGLMTGSVLGHIESGIPNHGRAEVTATFKSFDAVGLKRGRLIGLVDDGRGVLLNQQRAVSRIFSDVGPRVSVAKNSPIMLGESQSGISHPEKAQVQRLGDTAMFGVEVQLLPVHIEYNGQIAPLACAKDLLDTRE